MGQEAVWHSFVLAVVRRQRSAECAKLRSCEGPVSVDREGVVEDRSSWVIQRQVSKAQTTGDTGQGHDWR